MEVVIFLRAPSWLLHVLQGAPDENRDPLDRVVAALRWRILLEGITLGLIDRQRVAWSFLGGLFPVECSLDFLVRLSVYLLFTWICCGSVSCFLASLYLALGACGVVSLVVSWLWLYI